MRGQINKEYSGSTTAREPDTATMKNVIYTVLAVLLALLLISTQYNNSNNLADNGIAEVERASAMEDTPEPVQAEPVPPVEPQWHELSTVEKIRLNPQGCDLVKQIMHEDGSCHDKAMVPPPVSAPSAPSGTCEEWMAQAGIPLTDATKTLILKESGCDPLVWNKAGSGAYGIPQALPRTKLLDPAQCGGADGYTNPVTQLKWMDCYIKRRYSTWDNALATWYSRCGSKQGCWY